MGLALGIVSAGPSTGGEATGPVSLQPDPPGAGNATPGPGMFLVARRALGDSYFGRSVIYLVAHDAGGTMGLIVNRPGDISLSEAVPDIGNRQARAHRLHFGGPVGLRTIFMLRRGEAAIEGTAHIADDVYIGSDRRAILDALAASKADGNLRFFIGYSGWAAGQLDAELERGSWHVVAAEAAAIFSRQTDTLWERLIDRLEPRGIQVHSGGTLPVIATATGAGLPVEPHRDQAR